MRYLAFFLTATIFLLSTVTHAGDSQVIKIVGADFPPYYTKSRDDFGIIGKQLSELLSQQALTPEFHFKPFARALQEAKVGKADIIAALYKTQERESFFIYSPPFISSDIKLFTLKHPTFLYKTPSDLSHYTIGKIRKSSTEINLEAVPELNIIYVNNYRQGLALLNHNRIDFLVGNKLVIDSILKRSTKPDKISEIEPPLSRENTYIAISKKSPNRTRLSKIMNEFHQTLQSTSKKPQRIIPSNKN